MTATNALLIVAVAWLAIGLVIGFVMRRRGHDFKVWLVIGSVLGPLAIPLAIERARNHPIEYQGPAVGEAAGRFDVLAGIDGSKESIAALKAALELFGGCVTSVTFATALDFDSGGAYTGAETQADAMAELKRASTQVEFEPSQTRLLFGRPDQALIDYATKTGHEMIVVGARGHGLSESLFGSVTERLVGGGRIPVFVGPQNGSPVDERPTQAANPSGNPLST